MNKQQAGFTLIELVMVIVILGILAATAAPRFLNLQSDARLAAVDGMAGALKSAGAIVYTACVLDNACDESAASANATVGGTTIAVAYGWPTVASIDTAADVTLGKFTATTSGTTRTYTLVSNCTASYTNSTGAGVSAVVATVNSGC
jgi:MSHA pilin protein MshA